MTKTLAVAITILGGPGFLASAEAAPLASTQVELYRVTNTLCSAPHYAIDYETERNAGQSQAIAIDIVGKRAGRSVCGLYVGRALVREQKVVTRDGRLYRLTAWQFVEDGRTAWIAESTFAPGRSASAI